MKMWCKCSECGHKLFLYEDSQDFGHGEINIKCSSCKSIVDVVFSKGKVECRRPESAYEGKRTQHRQRERRV